VLGNSASASDEFVFQPILPRSTNWTDRIRVCWRALVNNPALAAERQAIDSAKGSAAHSAIRANPSLCGRSQGSERNDQSFSASLRRFRSKLFGRPRAPQEVAEQKLNSTRATVTDKDDCWPVKSECFCRDSRRPRQRRVCRTTPSSEHEFSQLMETVSAREPFFSGCKKCASKRTASEPSIDYQAKAEIAMLHSRSSGNAARRKPGLRGNLEQPALSLDKIQLLQLQRITDRTWLHNGRTSYGRRCRAPARNGSKNGRDISASYERRTADSRCPHSTQPETCNPSARLSNYAVFGMRWTLPLFNRNQGRLPLQKQTSRQRTTKSQPPACASA